MIRRQNSFVTISLGIDKANIQIYRPKIEAQSPTFLDRLQDVDNDGRIGQMIVLEDVDEETVDMVINWLYEGNLSKVETETDEIHNDFMALKRELAEEDAENQEREEHGPGDVQISAEPGTPRSPPRKMRKLDEPVTPSSSPSPSVAHKTESTPSTSTTPSSRATAKGVIIASNLGYEDLFKVYTFASKYDFPKLKLEAQKCWQRLARATRAKPSHELVKKIFDELPDDVGLTRTIAEQFAESYIKSTKSTFSKGVEHAEAQLEGLHQKLMRLIFICTMTENKGGWCTHHGHGNAEEQVECYKARVLEREEIVMRQRKDSWNEAAALKKRIKTQDEVLEQWQLERPKTTIAKLIRDKDGLITGIKEK